MTSVIDETDILTPLSMRSYNVSVGAGQAWPVHVPWCHIWWSRPKWPAVSGVAALVPLKLV